MGLGEQIPQLDASSDFVEKAGDNMTGSLTIATDKIQLNTDGSAEVAGGKINLITHPRLIIDDSARDLKVTIGEEGWIAGEAAAFTVKDQSSSIKAVISAVGTAKFEGNVTSKRFLGIGPTGNDKVWSGYLTDTSGAATSFINADGSAEFAGGVTQINPNGIVSVNRLAATNDCFEIKENGTVNALIKAGGNLYLGGTTSDNASIFLNASDGSATFAGDVATRTLTADVSDDVNKSFAVIFRTNTAKDGDTTVYIQNRNDGGKLIAGNNSSSETFTVNADGSASFAGGATEISSSGAIEVNRAAGTNDVFAGLLNDSATSRIKADGSATFALNGVFAGGCRAGAFDVDSPSAGGVGCNLSENGELTATADSGNVFTGRVRGNTTPTSQITNDGRAIFSGTVTANGSILTRASGDLDVGERLEKADTALQTLKSAAAASTDFASLKAAIATALADI